MDYQISRELLPPMDNLTMQQQHISAVCMQKNHIWGWNGGQVVDWFPHWGVTERWWQTGTTSSPALRPPTSFMMDMLWGCVWHCVPLYHAQQGSLNYYILPFIIRFLEFLSMGFLISCMQNLFIFLQEKNIYETYKYVFGNAFISFKKQNDLK